MVALSVGVVSELLALVAKLLVELLALEGVFGEDDALQSSSARLRLIG